MARHRDPRRDGRGGDDAISWDPYEFELADAARRRARAAGLANLRRALEAVEQPRLDVGDVQLDVRDVQLDAVEELDVLLCSVSAAVREGRARLGLSQRELAVRAGCSQATVARVEREMVGVGLRLVVRLLSAVGHRMRIAEPAQPTRAGGEHARDNAGRRLPAHLGPYRLLAPHSWWPGQCQILLWKYEPKWSYRRRPRPLTRGPTTWS